LLQQLFGWRRQLRENAVEFLGERGIVRRKPKNTSSAFDRQQYRSE